MRVTTSLALVTIVFACGCSKEEISADEPSGPAADAGLSAAEDGSSDENATAKACPADRPGPAMVALPTPSGGTYCMDSTEVTQGQYFEFLTTVTGGQSHWGKPVSSLPAGTLAIPEQCKGNTALLPEELVYVYCADPSVLDRTGMHPDYPIGCVDWCDAYAYCAWAGKRLCGGFGGDSVALESTADPMKAEWMWACTQGGTTAFPYGDTYEPGLCMDRNWVELTGGPAYAQASDVPECHGSTPPFDRVYNLSGNRAEWQDNCGDTGAPNLTCAVHSAALIDTSNPDKSGRCDAKAGLNILELTGGVGFRCCSD